jgi:hypothetical protein
MTNYCYSLIVIAPSANFSFVHYPKFQTLKLRAMNEGKKQTSVASKIAVRRFPSVVIPQTSVLLSPSANFSFVHYPKFQTLKLRAMHKAEICRGRSDTYDAEGQVSDFKVK